MSVVADAKCMAPLETTCPFGAYLFSRIFKAFASFAGVNDVIVKSMFHGIDETSYGIGSGTVEGFHTWEQAIEEGNATGTFSSMVNEYNEIAGMGTPVQDTCPGNCEYL